MSDQSATFTETRNDLLGTGTDWEQIRDFVCRSIEERWGPRVRNLAKDDAVFRSFVERHGSDAAWHVARAAVGAWGCSWKGAPLSVERFSVSNDEFFALPILANR